jgi:hypothetical protein
MFGESGSNTDTDANSRRYCNPNSNGYIYTESDANS